MTPSTALCLEKFLGMSSRFLTDLELRWYLYHAHEQYDKEFKSIKPYSAPTQALGLSAKLGTQKALEKKYLTPSHSPSYISAWLIRWSLKSVG